MENGFNHEFILMPLITGVSHLMEQSSIKALENYKQGFVVYTALAANPATGKSTAMDIIRDSIIEIEEFLKIDYNDSKIVNGNLHNVLMFENYIIIIFFPIIFKQQQLNHY